METHFCDRLRSCDRDRRRSQKIEHGSIFCDRLRSFAILRSYGNQSSAICDRNVSHNILYIWMWSFGIFWNKNIFRNTFLFGSISNERAPNYPNRCIENNKLTSIKLFYIPSNIYGSWLYRPFWYMNVVYLDLQINYLRRIGCWI